jgi:hypothetical protein
VKKLPEGSQRKPSRPMPEPHVGIFWMVGRKPLIESTPLSAAETYGDFLTHPRSHHEVWEQWRLTGKVVPSECEYEEYPRGRVMFNTKTRRFSLLADRCILKDKRMVGKIVSELSLPTKSTDEGTDAHYRCSVYLRSGSD